MRCMSILTFVAMTAPVIAQDDLRVLPESGEPRKMLYKFQLAQAQKHFDARRQALSELKTPTSPAATMAVSTTLPSVASRVARAMRRRGSSMSPPKASVPRIPDSTTRCSQKLSTVCWWKNFLNPIW